MRSKIAVLLGILCLFASVAAADITRVSPQSFTPSGEDYLTIFGTNLLGTTATRIVFDGLYTVDEPNAVGEVNGQQFVIVWIPTEVLVVEGQHSVVVQSVDGTAMRVHGPAVFTVAAPAPDGPPTIFVPDGGVTAEAVNKGGAAVAYNVYAFGANGNDVPVTCAPASGAQFQMGVTTVQCSATDAGGTATGRFDVVVADTTRPVLTLPADIVQTSAVVNYEASATDNIDGPLHVTCSRASGSTFPTGTTIVECSASDAHFNVTTGTFKVRVTTGPPVLILPADIVTESTSAAGAVVTYVVGSDGGGTVVCTPHSGATFAIGTTVVNCTATNADGSSQGSFNVTVRDASVPVIHVPADMIVISSAPSVTVTFNVTATDHIDGDRPVTCVPSSGSEFERGVTTVTCTAKNSRGNFGTAYFTVTVQDAPTDTTPPALALPGTITREATSAAGAVVTFTVSALDETDGVRPVACLPSSGSVFAIATTTVTCKASDLSGNVAVGFFDVIVRDTTAPTLTLPAQVSAEATSAAGAVLTFTTSATDIVDGARPVTCNPSSGSTFPLGTTVVQCSASDSRGNVAHGTFNAIVEDTTPPEIVDIRATPDVLSPPNHKMVEVVVTVVAVDTADTAPFSQITSVSSNQPVDGTGDGDTAPDWVVTGPLTLQLRAERAGNSERIYRIIVECTDASGNRTAAVVNVRVPGSKSRAVR